MPPKSYRWYTHSLFFIYIHIYTYIYIYMHLESYCYQICSTQIFCVPNQLWANSIPAVHSFFYYSESNYLRLWSSYQWAHMSSSSCKSSCRKVNEHIYAREVMGQSVYGHRSLLPLWYARQQTDGHGRRVQFKQRKRKHEWVSEKMLNLTLSSERK